METSPSASRRRNASRTLLRLAPVASTRSASTRRWPGTKRPRRMRSRSHAATSAGERNAAPASPAREAGLTLRARRAGLVAIRWTIGEMIKHPADTKQSPRALTLLFTGDIVLDVPEPDHWLSGIAPALREADLVIGHLEVPHTRRGQELAGDVPAPGADPEHLDALARAGVHALTLAGNHIADCGPEGIADTIARLDRLGIAHAGAGADLAIARRPGWLEHEGRNIALLSYNCVGPEAAWAGENRAGCNYLPVRTADGSPVTPRSPITAMDPAAREWLARDIAAARPVAGLVVVSLHQGVVHTPARIEPYERELARAALR